MKISWKLIYKNKYITYSHEKQGFIMEKWQNIKNITVKNHCFLVGKVYFFLGKIREKAVLLEKNIWENVITSKEAAWIHILCALCI